MRPMSHVVSVFDGSESLAARGVVVFVLRLLLRSIDGGDGAGADDEGDGDESEGDAAGTVDEGDGVSGIEPGDGHIGRRVSAQESPKGFVHRSDVARGHQRPGDVRPPDVAGTAAGIEQNALGVDGRPEFGEARRDLPDALSAGFRSLIHRSLQGRVVGIDE